MIRGWTAMHGVWLMVVLGVTLTMPLLGAAIGWVLCVVAWRWDRACLQISAVAMLPTVGLGALGVVAGAHWYGSPSAIQLGPEGAPWNPGLDPLYRVVWPRTGCVVTPWSETVYLFELATARALVFALGPPEGAYLGPLPEVDEAVRLLLSEGRVVPVLGPSVDVGGRRLALDPEALASLWWTPPGEARVAAFGDALVVAEARPFSGSEVAVFDGSTGRHVASHPLPEEARRALRQAPRAP